MIPSIIRHSSRTILFSGIAALAVPSLHAATVLVDFGGTNATGNWNGISNAISGSVANAIDDTGTPTGITIAITSRFNAINPDGTTSGAAPYPSFATADSFYGNASGPFSGQPVIANSTVTFSNLSTDTSYSFTFYASRMGVGDNRTSRYTLTGAGSPQFVELDASNNIANTVTIDNVMPNGAGVITLDVGLGAGNNNATGFYYLGAVEINAIPEPGSALLVLSAAGLASIRRRRR